MAFIQVENGDMETVETFRVKEEETEEQTDLMPLEEEIHELDDVKEEKLKCGKSFSQHENLEAHMKIHSGESAYPCQECGKGFSGKGSLKVHMRSHTGEKPFICPQCGKSFAQQATLNDHKLIHTGEMPFTCDRLKEHLPTYQQYVTCPTRDTACLDQCYGNIQDAFHSKALPGLGNSDNNMAPKATIVGIICRGGYLSFQGKIIDIYYLDSHLTVLEHN
ncbi:hypothetical protein F2P79_006189 [Pimephales promelas]|nr:hypothetical protein F2P79_006189 [Pimephales promelas]